MLKLVLLGGWLIAVTAASTYGAVFLQQLPGAVEPTTEVDAGVESFKTEMTSVPMVRGGEVVGYVIIQLSFQADRKTLEELDVEPTPYLADAVFRVIFSSDDIDFRRLRGSDLNRLTAGIRNEVNERLGRPLVREVLILQLNFVRKEDIRTNWIRKDSGQ